MAAKSPDAPLQLRVPLTLILLGFVASHLPVLIAGQIAPIHALTFLALAWVSVGLIVYPSQRVLLGQLAKRYQSLIIGVLGLVIWSGLSLLWGTGTSNGLHKLGLLLLGLSTGVVSLWLLHTAKLEREKVTKLIIYAGVGVAVFSLWQFIGDNLSAPHWLTQIVPNGHWDQIDFSRVNGLSEEPQFLTTILLLPASLIYLAITSQPRRWLWLAIFAVDTAIFLALSRGGFAAYGLLALIWLGYWIQQRQWDIVWRRVSVAAVALLLTLGLVGWSGSLSGHQGSEWTVRRYIEQASGGLLPVHTNFVHRLKSDQPAVEQSKNPQSDNSPTGRDEVGVVEESTIGRLDAYRQGLQIWTTNSRSLVLGVGYGSIGTELRHRYDPGYTDTSIVNNLPIQLAAELGLIGLVLVLYIVWQFVVVFRQSRATATTKLMVLALLVAMAVQSQFYAALHLPQLWLVMALSLWLLSSSRATKKTVK